MTDFPKSFRLWGKSYGCNPYSAKAGLTCKPGDLLYRDTNGQIDILTSTDEECIGMSRDTHSSASANTDVFIYDDPKQLFYGQCSGTPGAVVSGDFVDIEGTTGIQEINEDSTTYGVLELIDYKPGETSEAANSQLIFRIAKHQNRLTASKIKFQQYAGAPSGNLTPAVKGAVCVDTTNGELYQAVGTSNTDWEKLTTVVSQLEPQVTKSANYTFLDTDNGYVIACDTDGVVFTLPAVAANTTYTVLNVADDGEAGVAVSPNANDKIWGNGRNAAAGVDNKDIINTKATSKKGDYITLKDDGGTNGWIVTAMRGTWAFEA